MKVNVALKDRNRIENKIDFEIPQGLRRAQKLNSLVYTCVCAPLMFSDNKSQRKGTRYRLEEVQQAFGSNW